MRKSKPLQLDLFQVMPASMEEKVLADFIAYAKKLISQGFNTTCPQWWRSRLHDMLYPGHHAPATHEQWQYNHYAESNWKIIWSRFKCNIA